MYLARESRFVISAHVAVGFFCLARPPKTLLSCTVGLSVRPSAAPVRVRLVSHSAGAARHHRRRRRLCRLRNRVTLERKWKRERKRATATKQDDLRERERERERERDVATQEK